MEAEEAHEAARAAGDYDATCDILAHALVLLDDAERALRSGEPCLGEEHWSPCDWFALNEQLREFLEGFS